MHYCWGLLIFGKMFDFIAQTLFAEKWTGGAITHPDSCCFYSMCHFCFLTCWTATYRVTPKDDMELNSLSPQEWMLCTMVLFSNITVTTVILLEGKLSGLYVKCWGTSVKCYDVNMHRQSGVVREVAILLVALIFPLLSLYLVHHFFVWTVWTFFTFLGFWAAEVVIVGLTWRAMNGRVPQIYFLYSHFVQIEK